MDYTEKYITKRWQDLSAQEWVELRDIGICNGCGGRGSRWFERFTRWVLSKLLRVLSAVFVEASCEIHDFTYWQGGDEARRKECDDGFFLAIAGDIQKYVQDAWKFV